MPRRRFGAARTDRAVLRTDRDAMKPHHFPLPARVGRLALWTATWLVGLSQTGPAEAGLIYNGSRGDIVFGVTSYGGGSQITPKWIGNNFTGLNDILASPGGTFQLANPVIANNI